MTLEESQIEKGEALLRKLDAAKVKVDGALWFFDTEAESWRLVLSLPDFFKKGPKEAYEKIQEFLSGTASNGLALKNVVIADQGDSLLKLLRKAVKTTSGIHRIRFSKNAVNGVFIEDALIYRLK